MAVAAESLTVPGTSRESDPVKRSKLGAIRAVNMCMSGKGLSRTGSDEAA